MPSNPFMKFWGADFYSDPEVRALDPEYEALYIRMLWLAWQLGGTLPEGAREINCRLPKESRPEAVNLVLERFFERSEDGWHNPRMSEEIAFAEAKSKAGKKGGKASRKQAAKQTRSKTEANA